MTQVLKQKISDSVLEELLNICPDVTSEEVFGICPGQTDITHEITITGKSTNGKINEPELTLKQKGELDYIRGLLMVAYKEAENSNNWYHEKNYTKSIGILKSFLQVTIVPPAIYLSLIEELREKCCKRQDQKKIDDQSPYHFGKLSLLIAELAEPNIKTGVQNQLNYLQRSELARLENMLNDFKEPISLEEDQLMNSARRISNFLCGSSLKKEDYLPLIRKTVDICLDENNRKYHSELAIVLSRYFHLDEESPTIFGDLEYEQKLVRLKEEKKRLKEKEEKKDYLLAGVVYGGILIAVIAGIFGLKNCSDEVSKSFTNPKSTTTIEQKLIPPEHYSAKPKNDLNLYFKTPESSNKSGVSDYKSSEQCRIDPETGKEECRIIVRFQNISAK